MIADKPFARSIRGRGRCAAIDDMDRDRVIYAGAVADANWGCRTGSRRLTAGNALMNHDRRWSAPRRADSRVPESPLQDTAIAATELGRLKRDGFSGVGSAAISGAGDARRVLREAERLTWRCSYTLHPIGADRFPSDSVRRVSARHR